MHPRHWTKEDSDTLAGQNQLTDCFQQRTDKTCMVDVARYLTNFLVEESCGKCTPCREGVFAMKNIRPDHRLGCTRGQDGHGLQHAENADQDGES